MSFIASKYYIMFIFKALIPFGKVEMLQKA